MDGTEGRGVSSELGVAGEALSSTGGGSDGGGGGGEGGGGTAEYFLCDVGSTNGTYVQVRRPVCAVCARAFCLWYFCFLEFYCSLEACIHLAGVLYLGC